MLNLLSIKEIKSWRKWLGFMKHLLKVNHNCAMGRLPKLRPCRLMSHMNDMHEVRKRVGDVLNYIFIAPMNKHCTCKIVNEINQLCLARLL